MNLLRTHRLIAFSGKYVRALRLAAWNALLVISGLLLIALTGEIYLRLANPFIENSIPFRFVDGVGLIREPNADVRYTHWPDENWLVSRTNGQGFLDREPVSVKRAADSCHIAFIGDSFVEAKEVAITDKFHVRLEEMAARELPHLDVTTQAYGISLTGQINQILFYDEYARHLNPKLVVLAFYINDFIDNSPALSSLVWVGMDPDRIPYMTAQKDFNGNMELRPPDPEYERFLLPTLPQPWYSKVWGRMVRISYFTKWMDIKMNEVNGRVKVLRAGIGAPARSDIPQMLAWADMIAKRSCCSKLTEGLLPRNWRDLLDPFLSEEPLAPVFEEALEYTAFGIDQFKWRADRDGASLAILAVTNEMGMHGDPQFERLSAIAETRGIPVISQYGYIVRHGHDYNAGRWRSDFHWNVTGHQWAAEAVLEWIKENQDVCD